MVPLYPLAVVDARGEVTYVTLSGSRSVAGAFSEAVEVVAAAAERLGRPLRLLVVGSDGSVEECAVTGSAELVDAESVSVGVVSGSPVPEEALARRLAVADPAAEVESAPAPARAAVVSRRTVMVANPKGGTGKTPVAVVLAGALAVLRPRSVVLVETSLGNAALRSGAAAGVRTVQELSGWLAGRERLPYPSELFEGVHYCAPGFYVVPGRSTVVAESGPVPMLADPMSEVDLERVLEALRVNVDLVVLDTGNDPSSSVWQAAARAADVLVVPVQWAGDAVDAAARMLDDLVRLGHTGLVERAVLVPTWGPGNRPRRSAVARYGEWAGRWPAVALPPDRNVAERGEIRWAGLAERTRRSMLGLAARLVEDV
ncbi:MAG: ParA family protein [Actinomycetia bacterium]|nr:ParA family protein [Actinomycetes bacterium]